MNKICTEQKSRDYLFDNYKALLIFLVVLGHFAEAGKGNEILHCLKWLIFSFHMPAFIFISGYFSKKKTSFIQLVRKLAVPYLVFEVLYYLLYIFILHKETRLYLLYPKFTLWYLMALFVWKLATPLVMKIPFHLIFAVAAGLWVGSSGLDDNFLSIPRILAFYPFFLLGVHTKREQVAKLREKLPQKAAAAILAVIGAGLSVIAVKKILVPQVFYGRFDYHYLQEGVLEGILIRAACYGISLAITALLLALLPAGRTRFCLLGERTMAVYLFHGLICVCVKAGWHQLPPMNTVLEAALLIGISAALTYVLSRKCFTDVLNKITRIGQS